MQLPSTLFPDETQRAVHPSESCRRLSGFDVGRAHIRRYYNHRLIAFNSQPAEQEVLHLNLAYF
ncbi:MAG TPA: hypothetical protein VHH35_12495, partial [Pyrinomonadaceae bacterium]|nr:hypothetical protein [Pyrinomonadaceae bacterium]